MLGEVPDEAVELARDAARIIECRVRFWRAAVGGTSAELDLASLTQLGEGLTLGDMFGELFANRPAASSSKKAGPKRRRNEEDEDEDLSNFEDDFDPNATPESEGEETEE